MAQPANTRDAAEVACWAPQSALYLEPDGRVRACCASGFDFGWATGAHRSSLREIWDGAAAAAQRAALQAGDFSYGCQECEFIASAAGRAASLASHFDRFAPGAPHEFPKLFDFALSSRCNLQCVMCNGELSSAIRTQREGRPPMPSAYDDRFFEELEEFLPHAEWLQFKGGEPFLGPENQRIWEFLLAQGLTPKISVTTNGTIDTPAVGRYVRELSMHPIVSVDAMDPDLLASIRVGTDPRVVWRNVDLFQQIVAETGAGMTLSFCMMANNWWELGPILSEADRRGVNPNVVMVHQPHGLSLLRRPVEELAQVLSRLEQRVPDFVNEQPFEVWKRTLQQIRSQIESPVELVVSRAPSIHIDLQDRARLTQDLGAPHQGPPLIIRTEMGRIRNVEIPEWAGWLGVDSWVGMMLDSLGTELLDRFDRLSSDQVPHETLGVSAFRIVFARDERTLDMTVYTFVDSTSGDTVAVAFEA